MGFEALLDKVKQAETALEAHERQVAVDWRQLKTSWRAAWTPGRILVAGLVGGFLVGRLEPAKRFASGNGTLQLLSTLAGLLAGGSAQAAADEAEAAADSAHAVAAPAQAAEGAAGAAAPATSNPDALREAGQL